MVESADFLFVMRQTGLTKGNLSSHMSKLEAAEFAKQSGRAAQVNGLAVSGSPDPETKTTEGLNPDNETFGRVHGWDTLFVGTSRGNPR